VPKFNRIAYAATHVVGDPLADVDPWLTPRSTGAHDRIPSLFVGSRLGVAEAMDTPSRGTRTRLGGRQELMRRALAASKARPGALIAAGRHRPYRGPDRTSRSMTGSRL